MNELLAALRRVFDAPLAPDWPAVVARGRVVARFDDGTWDAHWRVNVAIVEHPELEPGEVWSLWWMGDNDVVARRCRRADAELAVRDPGCFNLA